MPLAASITMTALSTAVSVRYVSSEKSSCPGVSSRLKVIPSFSKVITEDVTEIPRCCSIFIQSERRSEEHTSELQSLMRISYAVFCLKKTKTQKTTIH